MLSKSPADSAAVQLRPRSACVALAASRARVGACVATAGAADLDGGGDVGLRRGVRVRVDVSVDVVGSRSRSRTCDRFSVTVRRCPPRTAIGPLVTGPVDRDEAALELHVQALLRLVPGRR